MDTTEIENMNRVGHPRISVGNRMAEYLHITYAVFPYTLNHLKSMYNT